MRIVLPCERVPASVNHKEE